MISETVLGFLLLILILVLIACCIQLCGYCSYDKIITGGGQTEIDTFNKEMDVLWENISNTIDTDQYYDNLRNYFIKMIEIFKSDQIKPKYANPVNSKISEYYYNVKEGLSKYKTNVFLILLIKNELLEVRNKLIPEPKYILIGNNFIDSLLIKGQLIDNKNWLLPKNLNLTNIKSSLLNIDNYKLNIDYNNIIDKYNNKLDEIRTSKINSYDDKYLIYLSISKSDLLLEILNKLKLMIEINNIIDKIDNNDIEKYFINIKVIKQLEDYAQIKIPREIISYIIAHNKHELLRNFNLLSLNAKKDKNLITQNIEQYNLLKSAFNKIISTSYIIPINLNDIILINNLITHYSKINNSENDIYNINNIFIEFELFNFKFNEINNGIFNNQDIINKITQSNINMNNFKIQDNNIQINNHIADNLLNHNIIQQYLFNKIESIKSEIFAKNIINLLNIIINVNKDMTLVFETICNTANNILLNNILDNDKNLEDQKNSVEITKIDDIYNKKNIIQKDATENEIKDLFDIFMRKINSSIAQSIIDYEKAKENFDIKEALLKEKHPEAARFWFYPGTEQHQTRTKFFDELSEAYNKAAEYSMILERSENDFKSIIDYLDNKKLLLFSIYLDNNNESSLNIPNLTLPNDNPRGNKTEKAYHKFLKKPEIQSINNKKYYYIKYYDDLYNHNKKINADEIIMDRKTMTTCNNNIINNNDKIQKLQENFDNIVKNYNNDNSLKQLITGKYLINKIKEVFDKIINKIKTDYKILNNIKNFSDTMILLLKTNKSPLIQFNTLAGLSEITSKLKQQIKNYKKEFTDLNTSQKQLVNNYRISIDRLKGGLTKITRIIKQNKIDEDIKYNDKMKEENLIDEDVKKAEEEKAEKEKEEEEEKRRLQQLEKENENEESNQIMDPELIKEIQEEIDYIPPEHPIILTKEAIFTETFNPSSNYNKDDIPIIISKSMEKLKEEVSKNPNKIPYAVIVESPDKNPDILLRKVCNLTEMKPPIWATNTDKTKSSNGWLYKVKYLDDANYYLELVDYIRV